MNDYLADVLEARRASRAPMSSAISCTTELDGEMLGDEEIFSFLRLLLPAGAETTYRATGNFLFGLLTHPDQLDALRADRSPDAPGRRGGDPLGVPAAHHVPALHARRRARGRP